MTRGDLTSATTVLVITPPDDDGAGTCADLLARRPDPLDRLIVVPVGSTHARWQAGLSGRPELSGTAVSYVEVRTDVGSSSAAGPEGRTQDPVATISSPADLGSLGSVLNDGLTHAADGGERVGVYLHSLSEMLQFVDREFLFKFLHTLGARVHRIDGVAYYHLETGNEGGLRSLFAQICDAVVVVENGELTVSTEPNLESVDASE